MRRFRLCQNQSAPADLISTGNSYLPSRAGAAGAPPLLLDPAISSSSKCRGACGPDCPGSCKSMYDETRCVPDSKGEYFYTCTYQNVRMCGTHRGCQMHDGCYDTCAGKGEKQLCYLGGFCHCGCDWDCIKEFEVVDCAQWMLGYGPNQGLLFYSSPPLRSGPYKTCPSASK